NLRRRKSKFMEQQRPPIPFNRSDRCRCGLTGRVQNRLVVRIQNRCSASTKSECPVKVLRRDVVVCLAAQPHTKSPTVLSVEHTQIVLELLIGLRIERMPFW